MAERVVFLRTDAERIARAVRRVEGLREGSPLTFRRVPAETPQRNVFRIGTFTGAWSTGTTKTVTFKNVTSTPNTVSALNLFFPVTGSSTRDCAVAREGTAWYLIDVPLQTATALLIGQTSSINVLTGASATGSLGEDCQVEVELTTTSEEITKIDSVYTAAFLQIFGAA